MTQNANVAEITGIEQDSKSEVVKFTLVGEDYLRFNELNARLIFGKGSNDRKNKECAAKLGMELLYRAVASATSTEKPFVKADLDSLMSVNATNGLGDTNVDYKSLYASLCQAVTGWEKSPSDETMLNMTALATEGLQEEVG